MISAVSSVIFVYLRTNFKKLSMLLVVSLRAAAYVTGLFVRKSYYYQFLFWGFCIYLEVKVEYFTIQCYDIHVGTSSQIRLRVVRGNAGGIASTDMDAFYYGTYSRYTRHTPTQSHPYWL